MFIAMNAEDLGQSNSREDWKAWKEMGRKKRLGAGTTELLCQEMPRAARGDTEASGVPRAQLWVSAQQQLGLSWVAVLEIIACNNASLTWGDRTGHLSAALPGSPPQRAGSSITLAKE